MRTLTLVLCIFLTSTFSALRAGDTFMDYQNYDHGYCPECNCYPCRCNAFRQQFGGDRTLPSPPCAECGSAVAPTTGPLAPPVPMPPPDAAAAAAATAAATLSPVAPCDKPEPCDPAPVCAVNCGVSLCWIGLGIAVVATAAAVIVSSNNGTTHSH